MGAWRQPELILVCVCVWLLCAARLVLNLPQNRLKPFDLRPGCTHTPPCMYVCAKERASDSESEHAIELAGVVSLAD